MVLMGLLVDSTQQKKEFMNMKTGQKVMPTETQSIKRNEQKAKNTQEFYNNIKLEFPEEERVHGAEEIFEKSNS
jgi:hypothetical protein